MPQVPVTYSHHEIKRSYEQYNSRQLIGHLGEIRGFDYNKESCI
jgi:hypothetical protein